LDNGIGRDNISDFTTNLNKAFLLDYTQAFTLTHISRDLTRTYNVGKVRFNYETEVWESAKYVLPWNEEQNDYVILTPKDLLTKDDIWISRRGLLYDLPDIVESVPNDQLRHQINNYLVRILPEDAGRKEELEAAARIIREFPVLIEYYIRFKEDHGQEAVATSDARVSQTEALFVREVAAFTQYLQATTPFYTIPGNTYEEALERVRFLKDVIENKGGHRIFYSAGEPIRRETDLHILFRLTWLGTPSDVSREVDDGRGPADFKISRGAFDKTIVEFKLASNSKLRRNLATQAEIYERASGAKRSVKVIIGFTEAEFARVGQILEDLGLTQAPNVVLIDARADNKPSASVA
jgi:hypothetical protein